MPKRSVRLSVQSTARLALLVSIIVFAFIAALVSVEPPVSSACPVAMPKPLRVLYMQSNLVAVGRVGDSVIVEHKSGAKLTRTALHISTLLKGESKEEVVNFDHYAWGMEDSAAPSGYSKNDVMLVFLKAREGGEGYVPADYERGLKKLPPDDLKVYVRRIEELAAITRGANPDPAAISEWLVRCAEEPATRWEGAFELGLNAPQLQDPPQEEEETDAETDADEAEAASDETASDEKEEADESDSSSVEQAAAAGADNANNETANTFIPDSANIPVVEESFRFVPVLTPAQKERLMTTLLGAEELNEGEHMLLRLVGSWKDARLVPFLLKHLARIADKPGYEAEDMMRVVAHTLDDQTLVKFVANYSKTASYADLYDEVVVVAEEEDSEATAEERAASKKEAEEMKAAAAEALYQRSGKLRHFLALAAQPQTP